MEIGRVTLKTNGKKEGKGGGMKNIEFVKAVMIIVSLPDKRAMPPAAAHGVVPTTKVEQSRA